MAALITAMQRSRIFAEAKELGIDNDLLHELIYAETGCRSMRSLTLVQAAQVIDRLEGKTTPKGMATPKQKRFIESLLKQIGWVQEDGTPDMKRLEGFLHSRFNVDSYKWLTVRKASEVIEALKDMKERAASGKK